MQPGIVQRVVKATVPNGTRIVIENVNASDLGDVGTIIRDSQVPGYKAVRFDNERDKLYRVHLSEMSPLDPALKEQYGDEEAPTSAMVRLAKPVKITAEIDLSDDRYQTADFYAYNGTEKIGKLMMNNTNRAGFIISDVYSNLSPKHKVDGLGVLFLNIASRMAESLNKAVMTLAANRPPKESHPATFYAKFGFETPEFAVISEEAVKAEKPFNEYMKTYMNTIHMSGGTAAVKDETARYLGGKGWGGPAS